MMKFTDHALDRLKERFNFYGQEDVNCIRQAFVFNYKHIKSLEGNRVIRQIKYKGKLMQGVIMERWIVSILEPTFEPDLEEQYNKQIEDKYTARIDSLSRKCKGITHRLNNFLNLPWYKRIFYKENK